MDYPACSSPPSEFVDRSRVAVEVARLFGDGAGVHASPDPGSHRRRDDRLRRRRLRRDRQPDHRRLTASLRADASVDRSGLAEAFGDRDRRRRRSAVSVVALHDRWPRWCVRPGRPTAPSSGGPAPDGRSRRIGLCLPLTPLEPIAGSGRADSRQAHLRRTGHSSHAGVGRPAQHGTEIHQTLVPGPRVTARAARRRPSPAHRLGVSRSPATRAYTRAMFVSTTAASSSNANASTARAVYGPMPGSASRPSRSRGNSPELGHPPRRRVQVAGPTRVAETLPLPQHVTERRLRTRRDRRETIEERARHRGITRADLSLLEHDLAHEYRPRIAGTAPRQVAQTRCAPCQDVGGEVVTRVALRRQRAESLLLTLDRRCRRSTDQLTGVVTGREPQLEVDLRFAAPGLFLGEVAQTDETLASLDRPRPDSQRQVQQPAEQDRKEELGEAIRRHAERGPPRPERRSPRACRRSRRRRSRDRQA